MIPRDSGPVYLTEGDCFMFALEKKHMHQDGASNNTCRYMLKVVGQVDHEEFKIKVNENRDITWLAALVPEKKSPLSIPKWRATGTSVEVPVRIHNSDDFLPSSILGRKILIDQPPLLEFDIIYRSDGNSTIVFSWHHLVMDGHGAILLLKQIADDLTATSTNLYDRGKPQLFGLKSFWQATRAKFFVDRVSKKPLSGIMDLQRKAGQKQVVKILRFTKEETANIDKLAPGLGARFGRSPFYLACAARCVSSLLQKKGKTIHDFWIPVPRNQRRKGAKGPVLGNHLAFMFYRIKSNELKSLSASVAAIDRQTRDQIRIGMTRAYDILIRYLRRTPLPLYYFWIKGPKGGALSSFLFTVAADHPDALTHFAGHRVVDAISIPSNIYPPGLTFAFMHFHGCLQLMILYFEGMITDPELADFERQLRHELTTGLSYRHETA
jgi:hypothetical protein